MQKDYDILISKLNDFIREYYKNLIVRGLIYSFISLCSILIVFALIEHFGFFAGAIRSLLFWTYCVTSILIMIRLVLIPYVKMFKLSKSLSHREAAQIIGEHFNEVSDKLINILELKGIKRGNQSLIEASIDQKIKTIKLTPFKKAINWKKGSKSYNLALAKPRPINKSGVPNIGFKKRKDS